MRRAGLTAVLACLALSGCGELDGAFDVAPDRMGADDWASTELTLRGLGPRIVLDRGADGLQLRTDVTVTLGSTPAHIVEATGELVAVALDERPPLGLHEVIVRSDDGQWRSANQVTVLDGETPDAGVGGGDAGAASVSDGGIGEGPVSALPGVDQTGRCEADPALTPDGRYLLVAVPSTSRCTSDRHFRVFEWNGGDPIDTFEILEGPPGTGLRSAFVLDGAVTGMAGGYTAIFNERDPAGTEQLISIPLAGDPPLPAGAVTILRSGRAPSLTVDGDVMFFTEGGTLFELADPLEPGDADPRPVTELMGVNPREPAISPDGLLLVYVAQTRADGDPDLYYAKRTARGEPFEGSERLPAGTGRINTDADERDPFITAGGQLLFTSTRGNTDRHVFVVNLFANSISARP